MRLKRLRRLFLTRVEWGANAPAFGAAALSAVVLRFAFPFAEWGVVAWFGLAPLLAALRGKRVKEGAWIGFVFGLLYFYLNLTWLNTLTYVNPAAPLGVLLAAAICALAPLVFGALAAAAYRRLAGARAALFIAAAWTALEYLRAQTELGFPWVYLGHTQVKWLAAIQVADLAGVYGVGFAIVLVNEAFAATAARRFGAKEGGLTARWALAAAVFAGVIGYGVFRMASLAAELDRPVDGEAFEVVVVQPGVEQERKLASYMGDRETERRIRAETRGEVAEAVRALPPASGERLIVLPESVFTDPLFSLDRRMHDFVEALARDADAPILFGANRIEIPPGMRLDDPRLSEKMDFFNSAWIARPGDGLSTKTYDKTHLVPFGEYGSYFDVIPGFTDFILGIGSFTPGAGPAVFEVDGLRLGPVICFESCFPYLFRKYVRKDADVMIVVTNDAWYKRSTGARRHQMQSVFRAVESRRPVVRAANTGISCAVDPLGRIMDGGEALLPLTEGRVRTLHVSLSPQLLQFLGGRYGRATLYMRPWWEWFSWLCLAFAAAHVVQWAAAARRRKNAEKPAP